MSEYELDLNIVREIDLEVDTTIYKGADGTTFYPTVSSAGVISWTNDGDKENPDPVNIKGPQGDQGPAGQDGATFTPTVSSAGVISWSNDKGLPNPDSVNIKGPAGQNGQNGQNGATFTPSVSTAGIISWTNDGGLPNPESVDIKGPAGQNGQGVPSGGTTGQVLKKTSATDYATAWADDEGGLTILSYGSSSWNDFLAAYNKNAIVYCRASSNADPSIGAQGRMAFLAYVNMSGSTPTSVEFQYYRSVTTHSDAQQGDQVFVYKLDNAGTWTVTTREAYTKIAAGTAMTSSYSSGTLTLSNDAAVPSGGTAGQVLTVNTSGGYGWETPSGGNGLPSGGSSGQFLKKNSGTDYDATWGTIYQVPTGGSSGQFLKKTGSGATNYGWNTINQVPTGGTTGQVLTKTSSGYGWSTPSGGGGLRVICTKNGSIITADKTFSDINAAYNDGANVFLVVNSTDIYLLSSVSSMQITFIKPTYDTATGAYYYNDVIRFNSNGTIGTERQSFNALTSANLSAELATIPNPWQTEFKFYYERGYTELLSYTVANGSLMDFFDKNASTMQAFLSVDNLVTGQVDTFHSSNIWSGPEGDDFVGHILFSRSWVAINPDVIVVDIVELTWNATTDEISIISSYSASVSATNGNVLYS